MGRTRHAFIALTGCILVNHASALATTASDDQPAQSTVWDLTPLYPNSVAWDQARMHVESGLPRFIALKDRLSESPEALRSVLEQVTTLKEQVKRLYEYAALRASEDVRIDENQSRLQTVGVLIAKFDEMTSFVRPEVIKLGRARVESLELADSGLLPYRRQLELMLRQEAHTLGPEAESVLAASGPLRRQPGAIRNALLYADIVWPQLSIQGTLVNQDPESYRESMFSPERRIRQQAYELVMPVFERYEHTAAALTLAYLSDSAFEAKARHYASSLALALADDAMPMEGFSTLVSQTDKAHASLMEYLQLRRQLLGVEKLEVYDLRAPLGADSKRYRLDEGESLILTALAPLGPEYNRLLKADFASHAMHAMPQAGKAPGASTMFAAYRVQPFVMVNYDGTFDSVGAVAHEWGHAIHAQLFQANQPVQNSESTSMFLFDTPSLTNEMLLSDYMVSKAKSKQEKIAAISQAIELLRTSYFDAIAEVKFEMDAHDIVDRGGGVTARSLTQMYCKGYKHVSGMEDRIVQANDFACANWVNRPGVFHNFYFFKYLTAVSAAVFFVDGIEKHDPAVLKHYFELLKAGGSDDPDSLLKKAGFDAQDPAAYEPVVQRMQRLVAQLKSATEN